MPPNTKQDATYLLWILIGACLIHALMLFHDLHTSDIFLHADRAGERWLMIEALQHATREGYSAVAEHLVSHGVFGDYGVQAIFYLVGGRAGLISVQVALCLLSAYAVYRICRLLGGSSALSAVACGLYLLLPHSIVFPHQLISEAIHTPLVVLSLWLSIEALMTEANRRLAVGYVAAAGLLLGIAILVRPISLLWPGALFLAFFLAGRYKLGAIQFGASILPVALWVVFIAVQTGTPGLGASSHDAGHNLYQRAARIADTMPEPEADQLRRAYLTQGEIGTLGVTDYLRLSRDYPLPVLKHAVRDTSIFLTKSGIERLLFDYLELNSASRVELQQESIGWRRRLDTQGPLAAISYLWETQGVLLLASVTGVVVMLVLDGFALFGAIQLIRNSPCREQCIAAGLLTALLLYTLLFSLTVNAMQSRHRAVAEFALIVLAVHGGRCLRQRRRVASDTLAICQVNLR